MSDLISPSIPHPFTQSQLKVMLAICQVFLSPLSDSDTHQLLKNYKFKITNDKVRKQPQDLENFAKFDLQTTPNYFQEFIQKLLDSSLPDQVFQNKLVMDALSTSLGCYLLCGSRFVPFYDLSLSERESSCQKWSVSSLLEIRGLFKVMKSIALMSFYGNYADLKSVSNAIGYNRVDTITNVDINTKLKSIFIPTFLNVNISDTLALHLKTQIVIVGSGCGGGVMAGELATAGHKVLVVEKGEYHHPEYYSKASEAESGRSLFERKGGLMTDDYTVFVMAGSTFGGGSTINWSASLRTPESVSTEWATKNKLSYFATDSFQADLDAVCKRLGVSTTAIKHNKPNQAMINGCKKFGVHVEDIPQNTAKSEHSDGWCLYGCATGEKQSSVVTWLQDAQKNGAEFIKNCTIEKIMFDRGKAIGVCGTINENGMKRQVFIKADKVVVSAGSINSPALLLKSGLQNPHIGNNLKLHPVSFVTATFNSKINQHSGSIMTAISKSVSDLGNGYGAIVEVVAYQPSLAAVLFPWKSNAQHKTLMTMFDNQVMLVIIVRDFDSVGTVTLDSNGTPRLNYKLSEHDKKSMLTGIEHAINIMIHAGAVEISTTQQTLDPLIVDGIDTESHKSFIKKVWDHGIVSNSTLIGSAHQMSSNKMGANCFEGAVKPNGESWEFRDLYVADASILPTATGVNPMISTYAIAYGVAQKLKKELKGMKEE